MNNVGMKGKLCLTALTCLSVCVTEPAVCYAAMSCYEPVYNFIQILDLLKPNFEKSYGRMRRKWGKIPQTFPVEYLRNGLNYNDETRAAGAHRQFQQFFLDEGWWNAVTHNFRKFVVGQTACSCRVP